MLCMISVPIFEAIIFWGLLRHKTIVAGTTESQETIVKQQEHTINGERKDLEDQNQDLSAPTIVDRIRFVPKLFKYMIPLFVVYFSQYFINQGLVSDISYNYYLNLISYFNHLPVGINLLPAYMAVKG